MEPFPQHDPAGCGDTGGGIGGDTRQGGPHLIERCLLPGILGVIRLISAGEVGEDKPPVRCPEIG